MADIGTFLHAGQKRKRRSDADRAEETPADQTKEEDWPAADAAETIAESRAGLDEPEHELIVKYKEASQRDPTKYQLLYTDRTSPEDGRYCTTWTWRIGPDEVHTISETRLADGPVVMRSHRVNDLDFTSEGWFASGRQMYRRERCAGLMHGWDEGWHDNKENTLRHRDRYWNDRPRGVHRSWAADKTLIKKTPYDENGNRHGIQEERDAATHKRTDLTTFVDGERTGLWYTLYPKSGKLAKRGWCNHDYFHGPFDEFNEADGELEIHTDYRDSEKHGRDYHRKRTPQVEWFWYGDLVSEDEFAARSYARRSDLTTLLDNTALFAEMIESFL